MLKDLELFILFAENSQILFKISVISILLTFIYLVALLSVSKQPTQLIVQLNLSLRHIIVTLTGRTDEISPNPIALKEEEKYAKKLHKNRFDRLVGQFTINISYL